MNTETAEKFRTALAETVGKLMAKKGWTMEVALEKTLTELAKTSATTFAKTIQALAVLDPFVAEMLELAK